MNDWLEDIEEAEGTDDSDDDTSTLFEDNFRRMVRDGEVDSLNAQTIENQIDQISDPELLADAIEADDREDCIEVYRDRVGDLNAAEETTDDTTDEEAEGSAETQAMTNVDPDDVEDTPTTEAEGSDEEDEASEPETVEPEGGADESTVEGAIEAVDIDDETEEEIDDLLEDMEASEEAAESAPTETETEEDPADPADDESADEAADDALPDVNVAAIAPKATSRDEAAQRDKSKTLLVWGAEGTGKSHIAHSAPQPICYIDTEGKADELADKFEGKEIHYWKPESYEEAADALDDALAVLDQYYQAGHRGTIVVDSMGVMWEWAQVHHMLQTRPSADSLAEVQFKGAFGQEDGGDWQEIKAYHNTQFRDRILNSPYHAVLTAGRKEKYDYDGETMDTMWKPDGEKHNKYAVKDVVRLQTNSEGKTAGNLRKAARTRRSFIGLEWPDWEAIYDAIDMMVEAEKSDEAVDVSSWPFRVVDGQPVADSPEGADDNGGEE